ncbi:MAG: hypothetical protein QF685_11010 [Verrucomicrobiota bacterium]|nr:hypothetical protein [Verrucomicrobiota bacterium]
MERTITDTPNAVQTSPLHPALSDDRNRPVITRLASLLTLLALLSGCSLLWWRKPKDIPPPIPPPQSLRIQEQFKAVLSQDDQAMQQIGHWLDESRDIRRKDPSFAFELGQQIRRRLRKVRIAYEEFLEQHPDHVGARSAFASFLTCTRDEKGALTQWNRALLSDDKNAAAWNNLANHYGSLALEGGRSDYIQRAFNAYDQALAITPNEPLYHNNLAVALGLEDFRREAAAHYQISENKLPERALDHYKKCHALAPDDFVYAADLAEAYLSVRPLRKAKAHAMWQTARKLTEDPRQLQWVELQAAFLEIEDGQYTKAELLLKKVQDPTLDQLKAKVVSAIQAARRE